MNPIDNPYSPGAGARPPELAGRDELREKARIALARTKAGRQAKSILMIGLRGVGKTVLLDLMRMQAIEMGLYTLRVEAPESRSLPSILAPQLRKVLLELSRIEKARDLARRALGALTGFAKALRVKYNDIEVGFDSDIEPVPGLADNGDLEHDLQQLLCAAGEAAARADSAIALFIDELQYVREDELQALITALHAAAQQSLPVVLLGAGLPQLTGKMGRAKSYAERLFEFAFIGELPDEAARLAIEKPAHDLGVAYTKQAVDRIVHVTRGYPYFLQEWGKHSWDVAPQSPITDHDVEEATAIAISALDASFFRVRFDRLTPAEKRYLRAMAELGPGPHRSGDIAMVLRRGVTQLGPTRNAIIGKGMIWSPSHGDTAFTVPLFDQYLKRVMPGNDWNI